MGNIFEIIKVTDGETVCDNLKFISTSKEVLKELGEPIIVEDGQTWLFAIDGGNVLGFICYMDNKIIYAYTLEKYRKMGIFKHLYSDLPDREWVVNSSIMAKPIYEKFGFEVIKEYNICCKMKLKNA